MGGRIVFETWLMARLADTEVGAGAALPLPASPWAALLLSSVRETLFSTSRLSMLENRERPRETVMDLVAFFRVVSFARRVAVESSSSHEMFDTL